jgi:hypothetical protein
MNRDASGGLPETSGVNLEASIEPPDASGVSLEISGSRRNLLA